MHEIPHRGLINYENDPRQTNLPTQLTSDGIRQLFSSTISIHNGLSTNQQYILQIIKIIQDYSENKMCHLSDGFCYITCMLSGQARVKNIKGQLEIFDVVRIRKQDVIILGLERTPSLELCDLNILGMRLLCSIGQPVAYMTYFHNNFMNTKGSIAIADGQKATHALNISELLQNYPHIPSKWILKAKIVKKHDNINVQKPFLIIQLMDEKQNTIEGVFFGQVALQAHKKLVYGREYLFNNGQIKTKKNNINQFEIKFTEQSQIIPIEAMKSANNKPNQSHEQLQLNISDIFNNPEEKKLVTVIGKVIKIKKMDKGRCFDIVDRNSDVIQIVLWKQINDEILQGTTYIFQNLRTKHYNSTVSLQSDRFKTTIKKSPIQIQKSAQTQNPRRIQNKLSNNIRYKQLRQTDTLLNVSQIPELTVKQRQYRDVCGFLIVNTVYMDVKNFFKLMCPNCSNNQEIFANPLICRKCSNTNPSVRWNLRCHIIDSKEDIKCVMNQQLCEKLLKMSSLEGFKKLSADKDWMRRKVEEISHLEGIFKIKINPFKDSVFYNIVDMYRNDSKIILSKAYKDLKMTMQKLEKA